MSPIRAENRARYPADWPAISRHIRFTRAGGRCECAGECGTTHPPLCEARHGQRSPYTGSMVVLTVAHLDHTPENCDEANLKAMCQRCHLAYDGPHHAQTRAFVAQNGQERLPVPWDEFSVLFIGGDDEWKLGEPERDLAAEARLRGKRIHMGRVNSLKRMRYARAIGCDSADGTFIRYGPDLR